jgi:hypothetical protein
MSNQSGGDSRAADLAVLAAKAARVAKAASVGGPYGAATETARQFLPQLIKAVAIILIIVLLLPAIIFTSIPHFLFGWLDDDSPDVKRMTDLALNISNVYELRFDALLQNAVSNVMTPFQNPYVSFNIHTGNTNKTWFIAIISVLYQQDLEVITENVILQRRCYSLALPS